MSEYKKNAEEKFELINKNRNRVFIIHYSCESFIKHNNKTPRISSIAIRNYDSGQTYSFSINKTAEVKNVPLDKLESSYDILEKEMLDEYFDFLKTHMDYYYVHWNMRNINYGFEALKHRYKVLKGNPISLDENRLIDLSVILSEYYGSGYISHPMLENIMKKNDISSKDFLTGKEEADCFDNKEYIKLHLSTLKKVDVLSSILNRHISGKLKTNISKVKHVVNSSFDSTVYKIISVIAAIWTVISIPLLFVKK